MDTLQLLIDSIAKTALISDKQLTTHISQGQSIDLLDTLYKIGVVFIANIFSKCFPRDSNGWFPVSHAKYKKEKTQRKLR